LKQVRPNESFLFKGEKMEKHQSAIKSIADFFFYFPYKPKL